MTAAGGFLRASSADLNVCIGDTNNDKQQQWLVTHPSDYVQTYYANNTKTRARRRQLRVTHTFAKPSPSRRPPPLLRSRRRHVPRQI